MSRKASFPPLSASSPPTSQALVALIGTTITPYMQLIVQSSVVEHGVTPRDYKYTRFDTVFGVFSDIVAVFIIISTAATLHVSGNTPSRAPPRPQ